MKRRIVCVWFPNWPVQRLRPTPTEHLIIECWNGRKGMVVRDCSANAAQYGVRSGIPAAEAAAMVPPRSLRREMHDPEADRAAFEELARLCEQFSPIVGLEEAPQPSSLLLDITGCARAFGGETILLRRLEKTLVACGWIVRIAIADTLGAAWAMAHFIGAASAWGLPTGGQRRANHVRSADNLDSCRRSSTFKNGELATAQEAQHRPPHDPLWLQLATLPIEALRLSEETVRLLRELGVVRIEQLAALDRSALAIRFGSEPLMRLDQALGLREELVDPRRAPPAVSARQVLEEPTDRQVDIERVLNFLAREVWAELTERDQTMQQLEIRLDLATNPPTAPVEFSIDLFRPNPSARHIEELIRWKLERLSLPGPVSRAAIRAGSVGAKDNGQRELFASESAAPAELAALVDRLQGRLGLKRITRVRWVPEAQPERACRHEPLDRAALRSLFASGATRQRASEPDARPPAPGTRPLCLKRRPAPIAVAVEGDDSTPTQFIYEGREHRVTAAWGPERIETGWWRIGKGTAKSREPKPSGSSHRPRGARRDYFRVETAAGHCFWLFRRLLDNRWFLHGAFS